MKVLMKLLFFISHCYVLQAQNIEADLIGVIKDSSMPTHEKIEQTKLLLEHDNFVNNLEKQSDIYHQLGSYNYKIRNYKNAIVEISKAIEIREKIPNASYKLDNSLYKAYKYYNKAKDKENSKKVLERIIKSDKKNKYNYYAYFRLGILYGESGDFFKGLDYVNIAKTYFEKHNEQKLLLKCYMESIYIYSLMEKVPESKMDIVLNYKKELDKLIQNDAKTSYIVNGNLGKIYERKGENDRAIKYNEYALKLSLELNDSINASLLYNNIGALYSMQNKDDLANDYYKKSLKGTNSPYANSFVYDNLGYYLKTNKAFDKTYYYQKAIYTVLEIPNDSTNLISLPTIKDIKDSEYKLDVLGYLIDKANNWVVSFEEEQKTEYLKYAKETLYLIDELISLIRMESEADNSKLYWIKRGVNTYMLAVKVCYLLNKQEEAFYFMEKNKALLLLENLNKQQIEMGLQVPEKLKNRKYSLKHQLLDIERDIKQKPKNKSLQIEYSILKENYTNFLDSLESNYPSYTNMNKDVKILTLNNATNKHVSKQSCFVEYIFNNENGYGIFSGEEGVQFFEIANTFQLFEDVKYLKVMISKPFKYQVEFDEYNKLAYSVFNRLFPFKENIKQLSNKKLTVISDSELLNFPFEALTLKKVIGDFKPNYLIQETEISYLQSVSVFNKLEKDKFKKEQTLISYAPVIFNYDSLPSLQKNNMRSIFTSLSSKILLKEKATKKSFIANLKNHDIIYINTHAGINENTGEPWIAFFDEKLTLSELYKLDNEAELVILDACETALGKQERGEGIMSLSRGFFYNGTRSVIASQRKVNERFNTKILNTFFKELQKGKTKSKALHNAKLDHLNTSDLYDSSPYFWAAMTLTGNIEPVIKPTDNYIMQLILILLVILILFIVLKRKKAVR